VNLIIGGGVGEHGRNCFYLDDGVCYCVDCGIMRGDKNPYPKLSDEQIKNIKYLFLTHSHEDHIGAFSYFVERGFSGTVIGAEETLKALADYPKKLCLSKNTNAVSLYGITFSFGRSGHCIGAVWYRISTQGGSILFSGDYSENSAFIVDKLANISADIAVLDCAFGTENYNAEEQLSKIYSYVQGKRGVILPVPKNGRAVDLIYLLSDCNKQIYIDDEQKTFLQKYLNDGYWIKTDVAEKINKIETLPISEFKGDGIAFVPDAQLVKEKSRDIIKENLGSGASVLLTGYTDEGSLAEELLNSCKADKIPFNAHCDKSKTDEIIAKNHFEKVVRYHCNNFK